MGLRSFTEKTQKRERKHQEEACSRHEQEEDEGEPTPPAFSIEAIVRGKGETHIAQAIRFSWAEFLLLYEIAEHNMEQSGRGCKRKFKAINRFCILMLYLTSGFTTKAIATSLLLLQSIVHRIIRISISELDGVSDSVFAPTSDAVHCTLTFENYPRVFGIVAASPIFVQRLIRHADQYYSGKYRRHCVKVQVLMTPEVSVSIARKCSGGGHIIRQFSTRLGSGIGLSTCAKREGTVKKLSWATLGIS
jgi:hypothetical protein